MSRNIVVTLALIEEAIREKTKGKDFSQTARENDINPKTLLSAIKRYRKGITPLHKYGHDKRPYVVRLFILGMTNLVEIGHVLDMHENTVRTELRTSGITAEMQRKLKGPTRKSLRSRLYRQPTHGCDS